MAWYPGAIKMELQPESDAQPAIDPTQMIVHSIVAPWDEKRLYAYWQGTSLESHFGLDYDGSMGQYIGTETRADANAAANRRPDGTGAVSIETASNTRASDPWTAAQVDALVKLGVWLHERHGIPLRICRWASDPGYGYHRLHAGWSTGGTSCPGDARVRQFREVVFPRIVAAANQEEDVALTSDDIAKVAKAVVDLLTGPRRADLVAATFRTDNVIDSPDPANPYWYAQSYLVEGYKADQDIKAKLDALAIGGVDLDALAVAVADKLAARLKD